MKFRAIKPKAIERKLTKLRLQYRGSSGCTMICRKIKKKLEILFWKGQLSWYHKYWKKSDYFSNEMAVLLIFIFMSLTILINNIGNVGLVVTYLDDRTLLKWLPKFVDLTHCDFFTRHIHFKHWVHAQFFILRDRIRTALARIHKNKLQRTMDYRLDVCLIKEGAHIEHL